VKRINGYSASRRVGAVLQLCVFPGKFADLCALPLFFLEINPAALLLFFLYESAGPRAYTLCRDTP
jgi:hypothetical protein